MKKVFLLSLLAMTGITSQAQPNVLRGTLTYQSETTGTKEYAKSAGIFVSRPEVKTDQKTKKTTAAWHMTNMEWIKDYCEAKDVAIEKDYLKLFPEIANVLQETNSVMPMSWRLTEENNETVLHCYFRMPAGEVTNLWLTSEETCLVDQETGVQYRIRRTEPDTYRKHFSVKAKKGDVLDLKIFFRTAARIDKGHQDLWYSQLGHDGYARDRPLSGIRHVAAFGLRHHPAVP